MRTSDLCSRLAFLLVASSLVVSGMPALGFETPGAVFEFDAGLDVGGNATWTETGSSGFETLTFVGGATPTAGEVTDGTLNLLAHTIGADGVSNTYEQTLGGVGQASRRSGSFEVWFKPNNLTTADQIIQETGGAGAGTIISLSNDNLEFFVNPAGAIPNFSVSTTLTSTDWHQVVAVVNNTNNSTADDSLDLFLNGSFVGSSGVGNINDWAGGNQGGLGSFGGASHPTGSQIGTGDESNIGADINGAIHLMRYYDEALNLSQVQANFNAVAAPAPAWNVNANGDWNTGDNWTSNPNVPGVGGLAGGDAILGQVPTSATTIALNTNVELGGLKLDNANGYTISAGVGTLTLSGSAEVRATSGAHQIDAVVAGSAGLLKTATGSVALTGSNTFSGDVVLGAGTLSVGSNGNLGNAANGIVFQGATLQVTGTSFNTLSRNLTLTGAATIDVADAANSLDLTSALTGGNALTKAGDGEITLSNAAAFDGRINVNGGIFVVDNADGLGTPTGPTSIAAGGGTVEFDGSLTIADNFLQLGGRFDTVLAPHIRSTAGNSQMTGNIQSASGGNGFANVRLENAASGTTLTIDNTAATPAQLSDPSGDGRFVFQGTGNFKIGDEANGGDPMLDILGNPTVDVGSARITGFGVDVVVALEDVTDTVTIATAVRSTDTTNASGYYWGGSTIVESGTLEVLSSGNDFGELQSSTIAVRDGARFDVSDFATANEGYKLQVVNDPTPDEPFSGDETGQVLTGSGTIVASTVGIKAFEDAIFNPGDDVGTLNVDGTMTIDQFQANPNGALNYQLGSASTIGSGVNDLIAVNGTLALQASNDGQFNLNVTPVAGNLAATPYTIMTSTNNTGTTASGSSFVVTLVNPQGTTLNSRQGNSASVSLSSTAVTVEFDAAGNRTWTGNVNSNWDVGGTANWSGGDSLFFDLDNVTFGQSGARAVTVSDKVTPGSTSFNPTSGSYTVTGAGSIQGTGTVNVDSGTVNLLNRGNNYSGATTIDSGATLAMVSASTGNITNNGTLSVGGAGAVGPNFVTRALELNYDAAQDVTYNGTWNDSAPAAGAVNLNFSNNEATTVTAADGTFGYLTAAYDIPTSGAALAPGGDNGYFAGRAQFDGTFEVVFNVTNTSAGTDQVLLDIGGGRGVTIALDNSVLTAGLSGDDPDTTALSTNALSPGWHHAVVVVDIIGSNDDLANDSVTLYVDNSQVGTLSNVLIDDYAGSNGWAFGGPNSVTLDPAIASPATVYGDGVANDFSGQIALARYYQTAFDSDDVNQNFVALQDPTQVVGPAVLDVDGAFLSDGTLEFDVFGNGGTDLISISGEATLDGVINVSLVGNNPAGGSSFTILTATEGIIDLGATINLPSGFSSSIVDGVSLVLTLGLSGDFNGDGIVNIADYTVWRDNLGATEDDTILSGNGNGGIVDSTDYALWKTNFGNGTAAAIGLGQANVPEPSTLILTALMGISLLGVRSLRK